MKTATYGGVLINNDIWLANIYSNGIFKIDLNNNEVNYIDSFSDEKINRQYQYKNILKYNDILIFVPLFSKNIRFFEIKTKRQWFIELDKGEEEGFAGAVIYEDILWLVPMYTSQNFIAIDLTKNIIIENSSLKNVFKGIVSEGNIITARCQLVANKIEFAIYDSSYIADYNLETKKWSINNIGVCNLFVQYIASDGKRFYITNKTSDIFVLENETVKKIQVQNCGKTNNKKRFYNGIVSLGNEVVVYPAFGNVIVKISKDNKVAIEDIIFDEKEIINSTMPKFYGYVKYNSNILFLPFYSKNIYQISNDNIKKLSLKECKYVDGKILQEENIIHENEDYNLMTLISCIGLI